MSYCEKTKRQNHSLLNDTRTHNLRVKPGNFDLIDRKSGQRIEHTFATGWNVRSHQKSNDLAVMMGKVKPVEFVLTFI
jgi:hypothetical protein